MIQKKRDTQNFLSKTPIREREKERDREREKFVSKTSTIRKERENFVSKTPTIRKETETHTQNFVCKHPCHT